MSKKQYETALIITGDASGGARAVKLTRDELKKLALEGKQTQGELDKLNQKLSGLLGSLTQFITPTDILVGAFAAIGLYTVNATADLMAFDRELQRIQQTLNVAPAAMQVWVEAAKTVGIDAEKMADIFKDTSDKLGDLATTNGGEAKDIIERLGLSINDLINMNPDKALLAIAEALHKVSNVSQHDKIFLLESLASDASYLLPLLEDNAKALRGIETAITQRGIIITEEERVLLNEANTQLLDMQQALTALGQESGLFGAETFAQIAPTITNIIDVLTVGIREFRHDASLMFQVWGDGFNDYAGYLADAGNVSSLFYQHVSNIFTGLYENARFVFTYFPVLASAAFANASAHIESWYYYAKSYFESFNAFTSKAFGAVHRFAAYNFAKMVDIGGKAIGFLLRHFADFVSGLSGIGEIPGFGDFGESIEGVSQRIAQLAKNAESHGDAIRASVKGSSDAAKEHESNAEHYRRYAEAMGSVADAAIDQAQAYIKVKESQRGIDKQIRAENSELGGLTEGLNSVVESSKKYVSVGKKKEEQDKKSEQATKKLKKEKDELAKAAERVRKAFESEFNTLKQQQIKLTQGEKAAYAFAKSNQGMSAAQVDLLWSMKQANKGIEEQQKQIKDAKKTYQDLLENLDFRAAKLDLSPAGYRLKELTEKSNLELKRAQEILSKEQALLHRENLKKSQETIKVKQKELEWLQKTIAATQHGTRATDHLNATKEAYNALTEAGLSVHSKEGKQLIALNLQLQQKARVLDAVKALKEQQQELNWLDKEITATRKGEQALVAYNLEKETYNQLTGLGVDLESEYGKKIAASTIALNKKRQTLAAVKFLQQKRDELKHLKEEAAATLQGKEALHNYNLEREIAAELTRLNIDTQSNLGKEIAQTMRATDEYTEKTKEIEELRAPLSNFFLDVFNNGKQAFDNLGDYLKDWLKQQIALFAANKILAYVGANTSSGAGGLMGAVGGGNNGLISTLLGGGVAQSGAGGLSGLLGFGGNGIGSTFGKVGGSLGTSLFSNAASYSNLSYGIAGGLGGFLGDKMFGSGGGLGGGLGATLGMALGGPIGAVLGTLGGGLLGSIFGGKKEITGTGLALNYSGGAFSGHAYEDWHKDGGWFRSDKNGTNYTSLGSSANHAINQYFNDVENKLVAQAEYFGFGAAQSVIDGFNTGTAKLSGTDDAEQRIQAWAEGVTEQLYSGVFGHTFANMQQAGEKLADTLDRLVLEISVVTAATDKMGLQFNLTGVAAAKASDRMAQAVGGIENLGSLMGAYYQNFYSEEERLQQIVKASNALVDQFNQQYKVDIDNKEALRAYVDALNLNTSAGQDAFAAAMQLAPALINLTEAQDKLTQQLLAQTNNLYDALEKWREGDLSTLTPVQKITEAKADFNALYQQALAGNQQAIDGIAAEAERYLQLSRAYYASSDTYTADYTYITDSIQALAKSLENKASVVLDGSHATGLSVVPFDGYQAELHQGEAVIDARTMKGLRQYGIPVTRQASSSDASLLRELQALRTELKQTKDELTAIKSDQRQIAQLAAQQRQEGNQHSASTVTELKQARTEQRLQARFEGIA